MEYPHPREFPESSQTCILAELVQGGRDFERAKQETRGTAEVEALLRTYILRVFIVFVREAAQLGHKGIWSATNIDAQARKFLDWLTSHCYYQKGYDRAGQRLSDWISHIDGSIRRDVRREFERSPEWTRYEDILLEVSNAQATKSGRRAQRGYRTEVRQWMTRKGLKTIAAAAVQLRVSVSTLKSIMSERGEPRYSEDTCQQVLDTIRQKGA